MWNKSFSTSRWESPTEAEEDSQDSRTKQGSFGHLRNMLMRHRKLFACISSISHSRHETVLLFCSVVYFLMLASIPVGSGIDCFKCSSYNEQNTLCDDPFNNNYSSTILESPCMGGRKGRNGLFPATACIKLSGHYEDTGEKIIVRGCALDSGTLNTDTEIIRMSHCGHFYLDDRYVKGCLLSCEDSDGCNSSTRPTSLPILLPIQLFITLFSVRLYCTTFL